MTSLTMTSLIEAHFLAINPTHRVKRAAVALEVEERP
jgi:hypothetical protein